MTTISLRGRPNGYASGSSTAGPVERLRRVFQYRRIVWLLVKRDLKVRYAGSALGYVWSVLDPLLMSLVYWVIFTKVVGRNVGYTPYILFLVVGQLPWGWFTGGLTGCARSLRGESQMVRSSNVPRELWVVRVIASRGFEYLLSLPVIAIFALGYLVAPSWHIVLLPLAWLLIFVLLLGIGLLLAPLTVLVRDLERVIPIVMRVLFYMSPVLYSTETLLHRAPKLAFMLDVNPMVGPLLLARASFFPQELQWKYVGFSVLESAAIFALGMFTFIRLERQVLKEI